MPDLLIPCDLDDSEVNRWELWFKEYLVAHLQRFLQPVGFRGVKIGGTSAMYWTLEGTLGDGTPVFARLEAADCIKCDPEGHLGLGESFCDLCVKVAADRLLDAAAEARAPKPDVDPVKAGVIKSDGVANVELGSELRRVLGDAVYDLAAELRGDQQPSYLKATNLNPGSSTPGRFEEAIMKSRAVEPRRKA